MAIIIQKDILHDFSLATQREWLETNGLGGWASSTVIGAHTRRYHGILVAADGPPVVLLSKLDEIIHADGRVFELGCNRYPGNLHPRGNLFMHLFSKDPFPLFEYRVRGITVRKTIAALNGENTTIVLYEISGSESPIVLELVPLIAARNIHGLARTNDVIQQNAQFDGGLFRTGTYVGVPEIFICIPGARFSAKPDWYFNFEYDQERARGFDFREDLFSPGTFTVQIKGKVKLGIVISTRNPEGRNAFKLFEKEKRRRLPLVCRLGARRNGSTPRALPDNPEVWGCKKNTSVICQERQSGNAAKSIPRQHRQTGIQYGRCRTMVFSCRISIPAGQW
jgi:glycogen debranching enzyme